MKEESDFAHIAIPWIEIPDRHDCDEHQNGETFLREDGTKLTYVVCKLCGRKLSDDLP